LEIYKSGDVSELAALLESHLQPPIHARRLLAAMLRGDLAIPRRPGNAGLIDRQGREAIVVVVHEFDLNHPGDRPGRAQFIGKLAEIYRVSESTIYDVLSGRRGYAVKYKVTQDMIYDVRSGRRVKSDK